MKKNVWIINHYAGINLYDKGGRHYCLSKYLKRKGYNPIVICSNAKHNAVKESFFSLDTYWKSQHADEIGIDFIFIKSRPYSDNGKERILNMIDFYRNLLKSADGISEKYGKPDIIYASSVHPLSLVAGIKIAKKNNIQCVCEVRDLWPQSIIEYGMMDRSSIKAKILYKGEKWIYKKADKVVFTMEGGYDYIVEQGWDGVLPKHKFESLNNGVDLEAYIYNKENYSIVDEDLQNKDYFKVVYTGSIRKVNNVGGILDVAKKCEGKKIIFLIWGKGDEISVLKQRVIDENIKNVKFKGQIEKKYIPYITSSADMNFAHNQPSPLFRYGISFNKLFDYLAAGKPILCDFPSRYNPAIKGGAGVEVDSGLAEDIAKQILEFSTMEENKYANYCLSALKTAKKYDFDVLSDKMIKILESC